MSLPDFLRLCRDLNYVLRLIFSFSSFEYIYNSWLEVITLVFIATFGFRIIEISEKENVCVFIEKI